MMSLTKPLKILFASLLEIIRVITIFLVLGYFSGVLLEGIYLSFDTDYQYLLYGYMAIPILFFFILNVFLSIFPDDNAGNGMHIRRTSRREQKPIQQILQVYLSNHVHKQFEIQH